MVQKKYFKTKDYCKVKFSYVAENADSIQLVGLNSDWINSIAMDKKKDGTFTVDVSLPKDSRHEFKYIVNETEWINDPEADALQPNGLGGDNSVIIL
jgi:1,4-alpha-glucan branching enzyme